MNVLIITQNITLLGGTERAIANMYSLCDDIAHLSIISVSSSSIDSVCYNIPNESIIHLNRPTLRSSLLKKIVWYINTIRSINCCLESKSFDVIIAYGHNMSIMLPFINMKNSRIYAYEHINYNSIPKISRLLMRISYPFLTGIIALSETAKIKLQHLNKNIIIIPNSISFKSDIKSNLDQKRIIMIGRLSPEKGIERLIPIARYIMSKYPAWKIDIFGDGILKSDLERLFRENGLQDFVSFRGNTNNVKFELLNSSILLLTSYTEALPMVIIEAKEVGVPTVAYSCEGTVELIANNNDGFIVEDENEFINKVDLLINDHNLLSSFGVNATKNATKFSSENIKKYWIRLFSYSDSVNT